MGCLKEGKAKMMRRQRNDREKRRRSAKEWHEDERKGCRKEDGGWMKEQTRKYRRMEGYWRRTSGCREDGGREGRRRAGDRTDGWNTRRRDAEETGRGVEGCGDGRT